MNVAHVTNVFSHGGGTNSSNIGSTSLTGVADDTGASATAAAAIRDASAGSPEVNKREVRTSKCSEEMAEPVVEDQNTCVRNVQLFV